MVQSTDLLPLKAIERQQNCWIIMWHSSIVADLCIFETWITTMMKPVF